MDTKAEIMKLGEMMIRTRGYHAFSYADISQLLNVKNAAIHYHFPSKSDLGVAIIEATIEDFLKLQQGVESGEAIDKLHSFINIYDTSSNLSRVCIVGALSPCFETLPVQMQAKLKELASLILLWVKSVLVEGKKKNQFEFTEDPEIKANMIISSLLASLLLNKVQSFDVFEAVKLGILHSLSIKK